MSHIPPSEKEMQPLPEHRVKLDEIPLPDEIVCLFLSTLPINDLKNTYNTNHQWRRCTIRCVCSVGPYKKCHQVFMNIVRGDQAFSLDKAFTTFFLDRYPPIISLAEISESNLGRALFKAQWTKVGEMGYYFHVDRFFSRISSAWRDRGDLDKASQVLSVLQNRTSPCRDVSYTRISSAWLERGNLDKALEVGLCVARHLRGPYHPSERVVVPIVSAWFDRGDLDKAFQVLSMLPKVMSSCREESYTRISSAWFERGNLDKALEVGLCVEAYGESYTRRQLVVPIASAWLDLGNLDKSLEVCSRLSSAIGYQAPHSVYIYQVYVPCGDLRRKIAHAYKERGDLENARKMFLYKENEYVSGDQSQYIPEAYLPPEAQVRVRETVSHTGDSCTLL